MDEFEFRHLLENFPLIRSRDYHGLKRISALQKFSNFILGYPILQTQPGILLEPLVPNKSNSWEWARSIVLSCTTHADLDSSRQLTRSSQSEEVKEHQDAGTSKNTGGTELNENANHEGFWGKLMLAAEQKVGAVEAERFCKAFQQVYEKLVYEELPLDVARKFINS